MYAPSVGLRFVDLVSSGGDELEAEVIVSIGSWYLRAWFCITPS